MCQSDIPSLTNNKSRICISTKCGKLCQERKPQVAASSLWESRDVMAPKHSVMQHYVTQTKDVLSF